MSRLTTDIRESIVTELIKHRFEDQVKALVEARAALAMSVYEDLYSKSDREKIAAMPEGWLPTNDSLSVYFGTAYTHVYASGFVYGELNKIVSTNKGSVRLRILSKHEGVCVKQYPADHALSIEYDRLQGVASDLQSEIRKATEAAKVAVNRVATVKRLIEAWPEVEPFAKKYDVEKPQLPAIRTGELNALLGLPVSDDAA